jgi:hypothetical protein
MPVLAGACLLVGEGKRILMWLVAWYLFCGILIVSLLGIWRWLNQPRFRDEMGDITTEVGYEEDSLGNVIHQEYGSGVNPESIDAHIAIGSREGSGLLG